MQRLTWVSIGLVFISGCESGSSRGPAAIDFTPGPAPTGQGFVALYAPPVDVGPYPNDIYNPVAAGTGPTLAVPEKITTAEGLNTLDGFSTTAVITAPFNAPVDAQTVIPFDIAAPTGTETVFVLDATTGVPLRPDVDYEIRISTTTGTYDSLLEIEPLVPLAPQTTYAFYLTGGIESQLGFAADADLVFGAVRDAHLAGLTSVPGVPELDPLFPAIAPLIDAGTGLLGLPGDAIVSAWSMTTQSITEVLDTIQADATARAAVLASTGLSTAVVDPALGIADIYAGFIEIPYYGDTQDVLGSVWLNANDVPPTGADPEAVPRVPSLRIPLIATLPNDMSMQSKPIDGWPAVVYQHGVTADRTSVLAIADSFASQGFAVVAIDLPLHGVRDTTSPFYQGPENTMNPFGNNERHFFLDNIDAVGLPIPDGEIDDGRQIFNVANPANARDHIRQAVSDLMQLTRTLPTLDVDGDMNPDLDGNRIHHVGVSLGSAFSSVLLGVNDEIRSATMSSPFATWSRILTDPEAVTFGGPVRAGLAARGLTPGTMLFANFVRDLQTVLDSAEPANYAEAAAALHPLHVLEILGDQSVPNGPTDSIAGLWGLVDVLAGDPPLVDPGGAHGIVRFTSGDHASLLDPTVDPAVTTEMQTQMVTFAATDGTTIAITDTSVVQ
ncbi:MAG TPA: hypothetical protein VLD39_13715 [Gammaproteobacteria bacterium]|nr:hypothetical protein [Gammaproteobacteria bacterium]